MPFIIKINLRHTTTGGKIRTLRRYSNFIYHKKFNSLASTFEFDFYFDPKNQEHAEIICVSHLHECKLYYTTSKDPNYEPNESELEFTGFMLRNVFRNNGKPQFVKISGYSKPGVLFDCDIPLSLYPLENEGLTFRQIISRLIAPFRLGLVVAAKAKGANATIHDKSAEEKTDEDMGKTASDSSQNIASYLSELAKARNIVLSHDAKGNVFITTPNTKGSPLFNFDFTDPSDDSDVKKIPGLETEMSFNGQALHSEITAMMQADDEEGSNAIESKPLQNPLLPSGFIFRPKVVTVSSGDEFSVDEAAKYELSREIREAVTLTITCSLIDIKGKLISPNNTVTVKDPGLFLYNISRWFIQDVEILVNEKEEKCVMNCVLPFGYDFDLKTLKNVFVNAHDNLPRF